MGSDSGRDAREMAGKLESTGEALSPIAQLVTRQLEATERLQRFATQLISARGTEVLYEQILDTALAILHADVGSIQKFCPNRSTQGELRLLAHRGFDSGAIKRWEWV